MKGHWTEQPGLQASGRAPLYSCVTLSLSPSALSLLKRRLCALFLELPTPCPGSSSGGHRRGHALKSPPYKSQVRRAVGRSGGV